MLSYSMRMYVPCSLIPRPHPAFCHCSTEKWLKPGNEAMYHASRHLTTCDVIVCNNCYSNDKMKLIAQDDLNFVWV